MEAGYHNEQQSLLDSQAEGALGHLSAETLSLSTSAFRLQGTRPFVRAPHCPSSRASPYEWTVVQQHCPSPLLARGRFPAVSHGLGHELCRMAGSTIQ